MRRYRWVWQIKSPKRERVFRPFGAALRPCNFNAACCSDRNVRRGLSRPRERKFEAISVAFAIARLPFTQNSDIVIVLSHSS